MLWSVIVGAGSVTVVMTIPWAVRGMGGRGSEGMTGDLMGPPTTTFRHLNTPIIVAALRARRLPPRGLLGGGGAAAVERQSR